MRSIRRRTAVLAVALGATAALAVPALAELSPSATAGHVSPEVIQVVHNDGARLQFQMNQPFAGVVDLLPNQANQRIAPGRGCSALPVTPVPNQGVRCAADQLTTLKVTLGPAPDSFFHTNGSQAFDAIDVQLTAGAGNDFITTRDGDDVVSGGADADRLITGGGADQVTGDGGADTIDAGPGNDVVNAFDGIGDTVTCGTGTDGVLADQADTVSADCENVIRLF